jgi:transposase
MSTKLGRKIKLTPELTERICEFIAKGNYIATACQAAGIGKRTYYDWLERGERDLKDGTEGVYVHFSLATKKADVEAEQHLIGIIREASLTGPQYWTAAARIMESRWPDRWAQVRRGTVNIDVTAMERSL